MNLATHKPAQIGAKGDLDSRRRELTDACVVERARFGHQSVAQDAYVLTQDDLGDPEDAAEDDAMSEADEASVDLTNALYLLDRFLSVYPALNEWTEIPVDLALTLANLHDDTVEFLDQWTLDKGDETK